MLNELQDIRRLDRADIAGRATSYWNAAPMDAAEVFLPRSTEEVARILRLCNATGQRVIVQGGKTGCAGGADSTASDVVISLEKMDEIEAIDELEQTVTVQAGVILETLQSALASTGLFLPLDLGARGSCTIGGNIATNAGGVNVIRYGMMRQHVIGLEVVLADGNIVSSMKPMLKDNSGYDLKQLFIGSEGTLGVVTRAMLKLQPVAHGRATALIGLETYQDVLAMLRMCKSRLGSSLVTFELMWGEYYAEVVEGLGLRAPIPSGFGHYALIELECNSVEAGRDRLLSFFEEVSEEGVAFADGVIAHSEQERQTIWRIRDDFEPILRKAPVYLFDVSMGVAHMERYLDEARERLQDAFSNGRLFVFGHIGDGNLHLFFLPEQGGKQEPHKQREIVDSCIYEPLRKVGGSVSAEHGIGREKKKWMPVSRSAEEIALMKTLKYALDPSNILNAGVVLD
ncbi:FAD-binding oxidoreductase [Marinicaulis flavus]|uniref:FAD-binding oxidoreductase n=1 Tax=Hyphococcus luteus TaxID=2058213 RepID=A0A2S7KA03_9PROT|nr:FAD-binding oxidoreductase [Marinicaulis flavus]